MSDVVKALVATDTIQQFVDDLRRELAAERERRLEAELRAEQLREALFKARELQPFYHDCLEVLNAALDARPPSLDPLRELVRAATDAHSGWRYIRERHGDLDGVGWDRVEEALAGSVAALLALYPFLREAEGEVERG